MLNIRIIVNVYLVWAPISLINERCALRKATKRFVNSILLKKQ